MKIVDELNEKQKEALLQTEGAVLIIAGAGSGKTKVLTHKIAYLIEEKSVAPWNILAITFTNKAANEMKERVQGLIGAKSESLWIGTFHAICLKILRKHISELGYSDGFSIYDVSEQKTAIKQIMKDLDIKTDSINEGYIQRAISNYKNQMKMPNDINEASLNFNEKIALTVYYAYQKRLKENNAIDFDDIINLTIQLFTEHPHILEIYSNQFKYVLVDEYQDTNKSQFELVKMFSSLHQNITVVGDNDQGIYAFRGADIQNILDFEHDYPGAKVIKLEQNYRSTKKILDVANAVIKNNESKYDKKLWTQISEGEDVKIYKKSSEYDEARFIADKVKEGASSGSAFYSDFAVLYRMNTISRVIEEIFMQEGIPYKIIGGLRFYDRKEIKDVLAYLKLIANPNDNISFMRIINEPKRGIGGTTLDKVSRISMETGISMYEITKNAEQYGLNRLYASSRNFVDMMETFIDKREEFPASVVFKEILDASMYLKSIRESKKDSQDIIQNRLDNIQELYNVVLEYEKEAADDSLQAFLENLALSSDIDKLEDEDNAVLLMTMHASKGLEFPTVFLVAAEEGIFPSSRSIYSDEELSEERRLFYVGVTRAKEELYITCADRRMVFGKSAPALPSRFIDEIPDELAFKDLSSGLPSYKKERRKVWDFGSPNFEDSEDAKLSREESKKHFRSADDFLESIKTGKKKVNKDYSSGQKVMHKKYGNGVIQSVIPEGDDRILEIDFDKAGFKRIMANFSKLEILED